MGLTTQRELDAAVARAAKLAGIEAAPQDPHMQENREALIQELRDQRDAAAREAEAAANGAEPEIWGGGDTVPTAEEADKQLFRR
jgi:hypothetical protein